MIPFIETESTVFYSIWTRFVLIINKKKQNPNRSLPSLGSVHIQLAVVCYRKVKIREKSEEAEK